MTDAEAEEFVITQFREGVKDLIGKPITEDTRQQVKDTIVTTIMSLYDKGLFPKWECELVVDEIKLNETDRTKFDIVLKYRKATKC